MFVNRTNMFLLEIDITYKCSLKCVNCDRMISSAPGYDWHDMNIEQIKTLINESIKNNYNWKRIRLIGGEPTIHPNFKEIIQLLIEYKQKFNKKLKLEIITNGYSNVTKDNIRWLIANYPIIKIRNSNKISNIQKKFDLINLAPCDIYKNKKKYKGCWITKECGIGLNYNGFYCCGVGGAIDRIFNYNIAIKKIEDFKLKKFTDMFNVLCSKCGHYHPIKIGNKRTSYNISPIWEKALKEYNKL